MYGNVGSPMNSLKDFSDFSKEPCEPPTPTKAGACQQNMKTL
jgi:hypothetical protein